MILITKLYKNDIEHIENYLALWICIKGVIRKEKNREYTKEELKQLPRVYLNSGEVLKLMGLDVKECQKVKDDEKRVR